MNNILIEYKTTNNIYYDVTKKWIKVIGNEDGILDIQLFFVDKNNIRYDVDGKNVILGHTQNELNIALWYAKKKMINIKMIPRVLKPKGVKCGDFIESSTQIIWEIKEPHGNTVGTTILNQFKGQKEKVHRFIIDMHLSDMKIEIAIKEIKTVLSNKRYNWIEEVILLKKLKLYKVFKKKK